MPGVVAVIVTYHPARGALAELLAALAGQVDRVVAVDNGSDPATLAWLSGQDTDRFHLLPLGDNLGVAAAQNRGMGWARQQGADYVVLFDQDSLPAADMVARLRAAVDTHRARGDQVAAAGPRYLDPRQNNPPPFLRRRGLRIEYLPCPSADTVAEVDYLISSGCLIHLAALAEIGDMAEDLFIDYVDIEWGLRAQARGYRCLGVCGAAMRHDLGEPPIRFFGRRVPVHSPLRHYYHFRNAIWLYRRPWVPSAWKLADAWRLLRKYVFYSLFARPRLAHWGMMTRGLADGWRDRMGRYDPAG